uniref:Secreted protein n=1 Tax=Musa acuminata subsp. malaccensis TaxID=214687 RepID=A0A804KLJ2_MUSAM
MKTTTVLKTAIRCCRLLLAAADCRGCSSPEDGRENCNGTQDYGSPGNGHENLQRCSGCGCCWPGSGCDSEGGRRGSRR